jgi:Autophagocytosis associated protein, active-site domain
LLRESFNACFDEKPKQIRTDYHVVLSQTWQVPVLFFLPIWAETLEPLTLQEIYRFLVEKSSEKVLEEVGVLGGISHGVHFSALVELTLGSSSNWYTVLLHTSLSHGRLIKRHQRR